MSNYTYIVQGCEVRYTINVLYDELLHAVCNPVDIDYDTCTNEYLELTILSLFCAFVVS